MHFRLVPKSMTLDDRQCEQVP